MYNISIKRIRDEITMIFNNKSIEDTIMNLTIEELTTWLDELWYEYPPTPKEVAEAIIAKLNDLRARAKKTNTF